MVTMIVLKMALGMELGTPMLGIYTGGAGTGAVKRIRADENSSAWRRDALADQPRVPRSRRTPAPQSRRSALATSRLASRGQGHTRPAMHALRLCAASAPPGLACRAPPRSK